MGLSGWDQSLGDLTERSHPIWALEGDKVRGEIVKSSESQLHRTTGVWFAEISLENLWVQHGVKAGILTAKPVNLDESRRLQTLSRVEKLGTNQVHLRCHRRCCRDEFVKWYKIKLQKPKQEWNWLLWFLIRTRKRTVGNVEGQITRTCFCDRKPNGNNPTWTRTVRSHARQRRLGLSI